MLVDVYKFQFSATGSKRYRSAVPVLSNFILRQDGLLCVWLPFLLDSLKAGNVPPRAGSFTSVVELAVIAQFDKEQAFYSPYLIH